MKKLLLGTTALIAAGAFVGAAQAADDEMMAGPVTVGVAGYTTAAIGFASDSDDGTRGQEINHVYEIAVSGSTTLDNGITVAVHGQLGVRSVHCLRELAAFRRAAHHDERVVRFAQDRQD